MSAYLAASGGWSRYNSGSHVDVSGASIIAGLAWKPELSNGRITFGPFFEAGWGSYNTDNSFSNAADVEGDGSTEVPQWPGTEVSPGSKTEARAQGFVEEPGRPVQGQDVEGKT